MTIETKPILETTMADLVMALHRVATALEQHVAEHIDEKMAAPVDLAPLPEPRIYADQGSVVSPVPVAQPAQPQITVASGEQLCPVHGTPFKRNSRGFYCSRKNADGSWCKETRAA